ncbi:MAG: hypothetical protein IPG01_13220 [Chitinophagaceae bacterium]|nr:hypothetical protein [Chitinophagaceae bacterium]
MKRADQFNYPCFYPDEFEESGKRFFDSYRLAVHANSPTSKMTGLRDKSFRTCRFCKKKMPQVTFNNDAHIIPQFLGNKYLISDFECDSCNALFSKYESDFARFLGIHRAMLVEEKSLKFNSSDKNLFVQSSPDSDGHFISMKRVSDSNAFEFDKENQLVKVNYTKGVYRPINVYKSLLKIALSIFDPHSVQDHYAAFTFLRDQRDSMMTGFEILYLLHDATNILLPGAYCNAVSKKRSGSKFIYSCLCAHGDESYFSNSRSFQL